MFLCFGYQTICTIAREGLVGRRGLLSATWRSKKTIVSTNSQQIRSHTLKYKRNMLETKTILPSHLRKQKRTNCIDVAPNRRKNCDLLLPAEFDWCSHQPTPHRGSNRLCIFQRRGAHLRAIVCSKFQLLLINGGMRALIVQND